MNAIQVVPSGPNSLDCISIGCYNTLLMFAYGGDKDVILVQTHTFLIHQILKIHSSPVTAVAWCRTGGRLASACSKEVIISIPVSSEAVKWQAALKIKPQGVPRNLSMSFFGDLLLVVCDCLLLWNFQVTPDGELLHTSKPMWRSKIRMEKAGISPDGRLIAASKAEKLQVFYREGKLTDLNSFPTLNTDGLKPVKLTHKHPVVWFEWRDISVFKLYLNSYNPNSLLTMDSEGYVRVWSEYTGLQGIGFNIVFLIQTHKGMTTWLRDFKQMENQTSNLAQKHQSLRQSHGEAHFLMNSKSCLLRPQKSQPVNTIYGTSMKERIPVQWFVIVEVDRTVFYMCEGLGSYPVAAIDIKAALTINEFWSPQAERWIPIQMPLFVIREEVQIQILGFDKTKDLVRWRARFDQLEYGGYRTALTAVTGGHLSQIVQIECHDSLALVCTVDIQGSARIWNAALHVKNDVKAVDSIRHWGVLEDSDYTYVKWVKQFAMLVCGRENGNICLYKWESPTSNRLKLPTMHWSAQVCWTGPESRCIKLDLSMVELQEELGVSFYLLGLFENEGWVIWKVMYKRNEFQVEKISEEQGSFTDGGIRSVLKDSGNTEINYLHYFAIVSKSQLKYYQINQEGIQNLWEKNLPIDHYTIFLSNFLNLTRKSANSLISFSNEGNQIQNFKTQQAGPLLATSLTKGSVTQSLVVAQNKKIRVLGHEFLQNPGEKEMTWTEILTTQLQRTSDSIGVTIFSQILIAHSSTFSVYSAQSDQFDVFTQISLLQTPKPYYNPVMLFQLLKEGQEGLIQTILQKLHFQLENQHLSIMLHLKAQDFLYPTEQTKMSPRFLQELISQIKDSQISEFTQNQALKDSLILMIDCFSTIKIQDRSFDEFLRFFYLSVRRFKNNKSLTCLSTMDIIWALHSQQQDTIFQILLNEDMNWNQMKAFGLGIWVQSTSKLRQMVQMIARKDFAQNRDPKTVTLWYMALGKKNILLGLYKTNPNLAGIYKFLCNDFTKPEWQVKALNNAFDLRKKRNFQLSAGIFILANKLRDAVEVLVNDLGDPQLALVICRLIEGDEGEMFNFVVKEYLLKAGIQAKDPWLISISHTLLKNHVDSFTSFLDLSRENLLQELPFWRKTVCPSLAGFHPSLLALARNLTKKIYIKRAFYQNGLDIEEISQALQKKFTERSVRAYLKAGLSVLALRKLQSYQQDSTLVEQVLTTYLLSVTVDTSGPEWHQKFPSLVSEIQVLSSKFQFSKQILLKFVIDLFYKQDLRHYEASLLVGMNMSSEGTQAILHKAAIVHVIVSRFSRDPYFDCQVRTLLQLSEQLTLCLSILQQTDSVLTIKQKSHYFQIALCIFLGYFLSSYVRGNWLQLMQILRHLQDFLADPAMGFVQLDIKDTQISVENNLLSNWFRYLGVSKLLSFLQKFDYRHIDEWLDLSLMKFNRMDAGRKPQTTLEQIQISLGPGRGIKKRPLMTIYRLQRRLESWKRRLLLKSQKIVQNDTVKSTQKYFDILLTNSSSLPSEFSAHFSSVEDFKVFTQYLDINLHMHLLLQSSAHSLSSFIYETRKLQDSLQNERFFYEESMRENAGLLKTGIEIFKSKDTVIGFAVNRGSKKHMAVITNSKKYRIRQVNIEKSLKYRERNLSLNLLTDDAQSWQEAHLQFTNWSKNSYLWSPALNACLQSLYSPEQSIFIEKQKLPPENWHRRPLNPLIASLQSDKTRSEKAQIIRGHPQLPLYVTGNESGGLTLWEYQRLNSIQDFQTTSPASKVTWLSFNSYGDKLGACDLSGNFFLYKFDLQVTSFKPQLTMMGSIGSRSLAVAFLNLGSVIATIGMKPRPFLSIYDTLLPPSSSRVDFANVGGHTLNFNSRYQQIFLCNKKSQISRYDLRMGKVVDEIDSGHERITGIVSDWTETTFVTGGKEGVVKIWDSRNFSLREQIDVTGKRSKGISHLQYVESVLMASTTEGIVKLLRTTTN